MGLRVKVALDDGAVSALAYRLRELSDKYATAALRKGVDRAAQAIAADAKARVPKRYGQLKKSIGRRVKGYRGGSVVVGLVGPRRGFKITLPNGKTINPVKYAHLVEYGRRAVRAKRKVLADKASGEFFGKEVRAVAPEPWLRPAYDANRERVPAELMKQLNAALVAFAAGRKFR